jgi:hypothetical protein
VNTFRESELVHNSSTNFKLSISHEDQHIIHHLFFFLSGIVFGQQLPETRFWKPVSDDVYLQETALKIPTSLPVTGVGIYKNECFVIVDEKIQKLTDRTLSAIKGGPASVKRLKSIDGALWALTGTGTFKYGGKGWVKTDELVMVDMCMHHGVLHAATTEEIFKLENGKFISIKPKDGYYSSDITMLMEDGSQLHADPVRLGPIDRIQSYAGTLHVLRPGELVQFDGKIVNTDFIDWGRLPSNTTRDMVSIGSRLMITTDRGLAELRGATMNVIKGSDGLPVENTTCLQQGFDTDLWIGTTRGAVRMLDDEWQFFGAHHWLPDNHVNDIAVGDKKVLSPPMVDWELLNIRNILFRRKPPTTKGTSTNGDISVLGLYKQFTKETVSGSVK